MKTILLVTEQFDPTADLLVAELRRREMAFLRWNMDRYPVGSTLTYRAAADRFATVLCADGREIDLAEVGAIWWRGFNPTGVPEDLDEEERRFAELEARLTLTGLMSVADCFWVNYPVRERLADAKPAQLQAARRIGFSIPETIITNDPEAVRGFAGATPGDIVYKGLSQPLNMEPGKALFTSVLGADDLAEIDLISATPGIFQQQVTKDHEVRATVVDDKIFAARIGSQDHIETGTDWRRKPFDIPYEAVTLPAEIAEKIHRYMSLFGLVYGAFDFIVTPDGDYVFLEVNPGGQYMWIESATGLPITAAIAETLSGPCKSR